MARRFCQDVLKCLAVPVRLEQNRGSAARFAVWDTIPPGANRATLATGAHHAELRSLSAVGPLPFLSPHGVQQGPLDTRLPRGGAQEVLLGKRDAVVVVEEPR